MNRSEQLPTTGAARRADCPQISRASVEMVVAVASRAPSIHNTQPWRWTQRGNVLEVRADRTRQLHVADRDGHSLLVSCGAAAELTELALRAQGWTVETSYLPDLADPDLLARMSLLALVEPDPVAQTRVEAALERRSERRVFGADQIPDEEIEALRTIAAAGGAYVHFAVRAEEKLDLAVAISRADRHERHDAEYVAEMSKWVRRDGHSPDGVPAVVIPQVLAGEPRHTDIPLRDFEIGIPGAQLITSGVDERPLIAVILTEGDSESARLMAGRSMMRLMIQAELAGSASCPLSQSVDLLSFRSQLRSLMSWTGYPQMMLRLGPKPGGEPAPFTARRPTADVLDVTRG